MFRCCEFKNNDEYIISLFRLAVCGDGSNSMNLQWGPCVCRLVAAAPTYFSTPVFQARVLSTSAFMLLENSLTLSTHAENCSVNIGLFC